MAGAGRPTSSDHSLRPSPLGICKLPGNRNRSQTISARRFRQPAGRRAGYKLLNSRKMSYSHSRPIDGFMFHSAATCGGCDIYHTAFQHSCLCHKRARTGYTLRWAPLPFVTSPTTLQHSSPRPARRQSPPPPPGAGCPRDAAHCNYHHLLSPLHLLLLLLLYAISPCHTMPEWVPARAGGRGAPDRGGRMGQLPETVHRFAAAAAADTGTDSLPVRLRPISDTAQCSSSRSDRMPVIQRGAFLTTRSCVGVCRVLCHVDCVDRAVPEGVSLRQWQPWVKLWK